MIFIVSILVDDQNAFGDYFKKTLNPTLSMMALVDTADMIGTNPSDLGTCLAREINIHSAQIIKALKDFIVKMDSVITNEEFKKRVMTKIIFVRDYGTLAVEDDTLNGSVTNNGENYQLEVKITDKGVVFSSRQGDYLFLNGKAVTSTNGKQSITYSKNEHTIYHNVKNGQIDLTSDSHNIKSQKEINVFEKDGVQSFRYNETNAENYFLDKNTNEKTLHAPSPFENYIEKEYTWRATNKTLLKKIFKKYTYSETDDISIHNTDAYLIGRNIAPEGKKLPFGGSFTWFDKELYQKYLNGECTVSDIWENQGDTYQQKLSLPKN